MKGAKAWAWSIAALAAFVVTAGLFVANCTGPKPVVSDVRLEEPRGDSDPYVVRATIRNDWRGHGQVAVTVRLHDDVAETAFEKQEQVTLDGDERVGVAVEIHAPRGRYRPDVQAQYPPM